jgi:dTDP-4-amino-4,6-dideoxygalactose transaminase
LPLEFLQIQEGTTRYNYAYFPVFFESEAMLLKVVNKLELNNIIGRRYFYPSLNTLDYVDNNLPKSISENIAARVLCLPLSIDLKVEEIDTISNVIHSAFRHSK